jgi:hypothetical protein
MYKEKKQTKQMIGGWRSSYADRLNAVIDKEAKEHGSAFTKGVLMDHLITLGLDAFEGNEKVVAKVKQEVKPKAKGFKKPSQEEVFDYMIDKGMIQQVAKDESESFINYFDSVGWVIGGTKKPMKSWKGAVATWTKKRVERIQKETKRYSFMEMARGDHLESIPQAKQLTNDIDYAAQFDALRIEDTGAK